MSSTTTNDTDSKSRPSPIKAFYILITFSIVMTM